VAEGQEPGLSAAASVAIGDAGAAGRDARPRKISGVSRAFEGVPASYFAEAAAIGAAALTDAEPDARAERWYLIGGLRCRIRYAGRGVEAAVHRALAHLETARAPAPPDLDIGVWDEAQARRLLPEPHPHMLVDYKDHCLQLCSNGRYLALDERWLGTRSYIDRAAGAAWYCFRDVSTLPYYEKTAPLRSVLNTLLAERGRHLVHAAAVGTPTAGLLLAGASGAGKSTTALSCLGGALGYLADDLCGIRLGEVPTIFSVYSSAKLCTDNLDRFPDIRNRIDDFERLDQEKATTFVTEHWRRAVLLECPVKAALIPTITGRPKTTIEPVAGKEVWRAMISWTMKQLSGWGRESIALITRFCAPLPAYRLLLGTDPGEVRATLEGFAAGP